jgi:hypothetical protein
VKQIPVIPGLEAAKAQPEVQVPDQQQRLQQQEQTPPTPAPPMPPQPTTPPQQAPQ